MARQQVITYTDDLTGKGMDGETARTVRLVVDRQAYELDVSEATYQKSVAPLVAAGRKVKDGLLSIVQPSAGMSPTKIDKEQNRAMRGWWKTNAGRDELPSFNERGRIPEVVVTRYQRYGGAAIPLRTKEVAPVEDVPPGKEPRKAGTVGKEMRIAKPVTQQRKPAKAGPAAPGKSPRRQGTRTA